MTSSREFYVRAILGVFLSLLWIGGYSADAESSEPTLENSDHHAAHHRHHVAVLLGGAVRSEHGETESGFAFGIEYEYRLHRLVGVGGLLEVATGDLRDVIFIAPVSLRPWRGLRLIAAPGAEIPGSGDAEFLFRLGAAYLFPVGQFSLGPEFNVDLVAGHPTYVAGLALGFGF